MKRLIAGNWKMNGLKAALEEVEEVSRLLSAEDLEANDVLVCPPATLLAGLTDCGFSSIHLGGQDCHAEASGAYTGDVSAEMLADAGASFCIVGHSERRAGHSESDEVVKAKAEAAWRAGLTPIVCVGESDEDREAGRAVDVVTAQVKGSRPQGEGVFVVAYEPIWAIGTGKTPTLDDIAEMHAALREEVGPDVRLLYGGSVKPGNAAEILAVENVDGALVGGASLKAADFYGIISA